MTARNRRRLSWLVALVALYAAVGFFVLPPIVRTQLAKQLTARLGRPVTIDRVQINPFMLSIAIEGLAVRMPDGTGTFVGWDRLKVTASALKSLTGDWVISEIVLDGLQANVAVERDGALNFVDILDRLSAEPAAPARPAKPGARAVRIGRFEVNNARVDFTDHSRPEEFHTLIGPVNFALIEFRTAGAAGAPSRLEATTESGEKINWVGTLSAAPLASNGEWRIENLHLPKYTPYLSTFLAGHIVSGDFSSTGRYEMSFAPDSHRLLVKDATGKLTGLRVNESGSDRAALELASFDVTGVDADLFARHASVDSIHLNSGRATVRRDANGAINLLALLAPGKPATAAAAASASAPPVKPFDLDVKEVALRDFELGWHDLAASRPVQIDVSRLDATLQNFSLKPGTAIPLDVTFGLPPQGTAHISGDLMLQPMQADLTLEFAWVPLPPLSPYVEQFVAAHVTKGTASLKGRASIALAPDAPPNVRFTGDTRFEDVALTDAHGGDLAGFSEFSFTALKATALPKLAVSVDQIKLGSPYAHVTRDAKGVLNVSTLAPANGGAPSTPAPVGVVPPTAAPPGPEISVGQFTVSGGDFSFADQSVQPAVQAELKDVSVSVRDLSTVQPDRGSIELHAMADGTAPIDAVGRVSPFGRTLFLDLKVTGRSVDLLPAAPYVGKFAGYELDRGRLSLDTQARLAQDKLDMSNALTLDQFTLGAATNSPDAVKLPVKLGVALLKDGSGRISLDIPVQGSLSDPSFKIAGVVSHVLTNLLAKAATAPFALLGSMFGGGGEELAQDEFLPGGTTLTTESIKRLDTVQRALADRPALSLEIRGGYDPRADVAALQRQKLDEQVRRRAWDAQHARDPNAVAFDQYQPAPSDYNVALGQLFAEKFQGAPPPAAEPAQPPASDAAPQPLPPAPPAPATLAPSAEPSTPAVKAPPPQEHRGFFGRMTDRLTFKAYRERRAQRRAEKKERKEEEQAAQAAQAEREREAQAEQQAAAARAAAGPAAGASASMAPNVSPDEMKARLAAAITVTPDDLRALGEARAQVVRSRLIDGGRIAPERIRIAKTPDPHGARATLHLE